MHNFRGQFQQPYNEFSRVTPVSFKLKVHRNTLITIGEKIQFFDYAIRFYNCDSCPNGADPYVNHSLHRIHSIHIEFRSSSCKSQFNFLFVQIVSDIKFSQLKRTWKMEQPRSIRFWNGKTNIQHRKLLHSWIGLNL